MRSDKRGVSCIYYNMTFVACTSVSFTTTGNYFSVISFRNEIHASADQTILSSSFHLPGIQRLFRRKSRYDANSIGRLNVTKASWLAGDETAEKPLTDVTL